MSEDKVYAFPNRNAPGFPIGFDPEFCDGCNVCVNVCEVDVFIPHPEKGKEPILLYPEECWYCGNCVTQCTRPEGAIWLNHPLTQRVRWKRKDTDEHFRV